MIRCFVVLDPEGCQAKDPSLLSEPTWYRQQTDVEEHLFSKWKEGAASHYQHSNPIQSHPIQTNETKQTGKLKW